MFCELLFNTLFTHINQITSYAGKGELVGGIGWGGVGFIKVSGTMSGMTACIIQQHIQHAIELLYNMHQVYQLTLIKILDTNTGIYCLVAYNQAPCKKKFSNIVLC